MKFKKLLAAVLIFSAFSAKAQLYIDNAQLTIQSGASVVVQGDVNSNSNILGDGKLVMKGSGAQNFNMNGNMVPNLEIDNAANVILTGNAQVGTSLTMTNGKLNLGANNLTIGASATIAGADASKFIVTDSTGKLVKTNLGSTAFTYPVGNSATTYNPVSISNSGTADNIGVRCLANVLKQGTTGTALTTDVVDASWDISEDVAGGSNLSVTANWNATDELTGFNRSKGGIAN